MVGGGDKGRSSGAVHRIAASLDLQIELVAGCFSATSRTLAEPASSSTSIPRAATKRPRLWPQPKSGCRPTAASISSRIVTPNRLHCVIATALPERRVSRRLRQADDLHARRGEAVGRLVERTGLVFALAHKTRGTHWCVMPRRLFPVRLDGAAGRKVIVEYLQRLLDGAARKARNKQAPGAFDPSQGEDGGRWATSYPLRQPVEYVTATPIAALCADKSTSCPTAGSMKTSTPSLRFQGGGKGVLTISQVATARRTAPAGCGVYARKARSSGRIEPNYLLRVYAAAPAPSVDPRPRPDLSARKAAGRHASATGHPEGYFEAFCHGLLRRGRDDSPAPSTAADEARRVRLPDRCTMACGACGHRQGRRVVRKRIVFGYRCSTWVSRPCQNR